MKVTTKFMVEVASTKDPSMHDIEDIVEVLKRADHFYHNGEQSPMTDEQYDKLKKFVEYSVPHHEYLIGVGAEVRGGKVTLPYQMGSLDQVYEGEIQKWIDKWKLHKHELVVSDKLDGVSAMLIYDRTGSLQIAYSRGDGVLGADITRHIKKIVNVPQKINYNSGLVIRAEIIIQPDDFKFLRDKVKSRAGEPYKNPRNMVAGVMNAKTNPSIIYDYLHVVVYELINQFDTSKRAHLNFAANNGFETVYSTMMAAHQIDDSVLANYLNNRRLSTKYEIDGIVIDVNDVEKRAWMDPTRETLNPAYSVKYKVADASNLTEATVKKVHWNVSKHGYLKPRVEIEPVELVGVTIKHATGFNAKFIKENNIGPGSVIKITRSGDVIPFIMEVITPTKAQMPNDDWEWNETEVDAVLKDHTSNYTVTLNRLIDFFSTLDVPHLKKGNIESLLDDGFDTPESIITATLQQISNSVNSDKIGKKIYDGIQTKLNDIELYKLIGAFSTARGIGVRRIKKVQEEIGGDNLVKLINEHNETKLKKLIHNIDGFEQKTTDATVNVLIKFDTFLQHIDEYITIKTDDLNMSGVLTNEKVVFTGFRDKNLQQQVESAGGKMQTSVSGKTTMVVTTDPSSSSGKLVKARKHGAKIITVDELKDILT